MQEKWIVETNAEEPEIPCSGLKENRRIYVADSREQAMQYVFAQVDSLCRTSWKEGPENFSIREVQIHLNKDGGMNFQASGDTEENWHEWEIARAAILPAEGSTNGEGRTITRSETLWDTAIDLQHDWSKYLALRDKARRTREPFLHFPAGTEWGTIEAWFDTRYPGGLEELKKDASLF